MNNEEIQGRGASLARLVKYQLDHISDVITRFNQTYDTEFKINLEISPGVGTNPDAMQFTLSDSLGNSKYWIATVDYSKEERAGSFVFLSHYVMGRITFEYLTGLIIKGNMGRQIITTNE